MPKLKLKETGNLLCKEGETVVFLTDKPNIPTREDIIQVAYIRKPNNTFDVWFNNGDEDVNKAWKLHLKNIKMKKAMAMAHYDHLRWAEFQKTATAKRKASNDVFTQEKLRRAVRYKYDLQKVRIQTGNRDSDQAEPAVLEGDDKEFLGEQSIGILAIERSVDKEIESMLPSFPIYKWLEAQKGCGIVISGVLIGEIDIHDRRKKLLEQELDDCVEEADQIVDSKKKKDRERYMELTKRIWDIRDRLPNIKPCDTVSALWAYCGLAVDPETGRAVRRVKGEKGNWNPFLKAKVLYVLGSSLLKAQGPWSKYYYDYKHRKENAGIRCQLCEGEGYIRGFKPAKKGSKNAKLCFNCEGDAENAPWGKSGDHRHKAANRYMVKMFLQELWIQWRTIEGLPVTEPYAVAVLGRKHGDHGGMNITKDDGDDDE